jgi:hypothetical protein
MIDGNKKIFDIKCNTKDNIRSTNDGVVCFFESQFAKGPLTERRTL